MAQQTTNFVLEGGDVLAQMLKKYAPKIRDAIQDSAVGAGATVIKKEAQKNLKRNGSIQSGNLYRSLKTQKVKGTHGAYKIFTQGRYAPKGQRGPHAHLVEFGTGPRELDEPRQTRLPDGKWVVTTHTGSMPAKPFFRPAIDEHKPEILRKMMQQAAKRMAKEAEKMVGPYSKMSKSYKRKLAA
jgi:HK97 gp10 family phage protein